MNFDRGEQSRVCEHGSLKRKCELCERNQEISRLKAKLDQVRLDLESIVSAQGHRDARQGCRYIVETAREALKNLEE